jgi:mRNA interferase MazF
MIQGDVYWYKFKEPNKERPVLILTRTDLIPLLNVVTVAEITTTLRDNDSEVWLDESDTMHKECAINLTNIQTISQAKIGKLITHLSPERMSEVRGALEFVFNFKNL